MINILDIGRTMVILGDSLFTTLFISVLIFEAPTVLSVIAGSMMCLYWAARLKVLIKNNYKNSIWEFIKSFFKL